MSSTDVYLVLQGAGADDDTERVARQLRRELTELGFSVRSGVLSDSLPGGAKSGSAVAIGELVVTLSGSGGVLVTLIGVLRGWLSNRSARDRVSVTIEGDTLELGTASDAEREQIIEAYIRAHAKST